jgi:hypothetical protein
MQTNFFGFLVKNPITFLNLIHTFFDSFCMKNRKLKNLDQLYRKIYKSSIAEFWICCVSCHD